MIEFDKNKDKVALIAPASGIKNDQSGMDIKAGFSALREAESIFNDFGIKCKYDEKIFSAHMLPYFAASKQERLRQLKLAMEDPEVKIISIVRGGYGSGEIIFDAMAVTLLLPKIFIGFSDGTALHYLFNRHYNLPSIHGLVAASYKQTANKVISILEGKPAKFLLEPLSKTAQSNKSISGSMKTTGGNLSLVCNMIGTKLHPITENKLLILEDINEAGYKIHRYLLHMYNAGLFSDIGAVIFGDFIGSDDQIQPSIKSFTEEYLTEIPVYTTQNIGHGKHNHPFTLGSYATIENNILSIESPFKLT